MLHRRLQPVATATAYSSRNEYTGVSLEIYLYAQLNCFFLTLLQHDVAFVRLEHMPSSGSDV